MFIMSVSCTPLSDTAMNWWYCYCSDSVECSYPTARMHWSLAKNKLDFVAKLEDRCLHTEPVSEEYWEELARSSLLTVHRRVCNIVADVLSCLTRGSPCCCWSFIGRNCQEDTWHCWRIIWPFVSVCCVHLLDIGVFHWWLSACIFVTY